MNLPYPSFSKAHSKEAVGSRDNVANPRLSYYTPDPTDIERGKAVETEDELEDSPRVAPPSRAPPSPPETTMDQKVKLEKVKLDRKSDKVKVERKRTDLQKAADDLKRRLGRTSSIASEREKDRSLHSSRSKASMRKSGKDEAESKSSTKKSKPSTPLKLRPKPATVEDSASATSLRRPSSMPSSATNSETTDTSINDSDTTSVAPIQPKLQRPVTPNSNHSSSLLTDPNSSPTTPTIADPRFSSCIKETGAFATDESPMPPPPPPMPNLPMPRVDYLMQNGGLPRSVPRSLLNIGLPVETQLPASTTPGQVEKFFAPFNNLLDDYSKVMSRSGSLAVATGYRSVARRLLDRLEAVFARDISSETCTCVLCQTSPISDAELNDKRSVSWGEILEYVCGRQELPQWPAFVLDSAQTDLGLSPSAQTPPMQKLDVDVPDELRTHYLRQSKKTKESVDRWLASQPQQPYSPPQDFDDDTLTFAMLTRLDPEQRPVFSSLVGVTPSRSASAAGVPSTSPETDLLPKTGLAIQRLYRLTTPPRYPESAMYLLMNPPIHDVLATLAVISDAEWEVLTSGRFDGFLRSGADDVPATTAPPPPPSRGPASRMTTPALPPSRGPTPAPATAGAPVALDEETEIAVLAEVEREIFNSMEQLENHFELLHIKAEAVRRALRERGAGLAQANQRRRGISDLDARMGTPGSHLGDGYRGWDSETDDGFGDGMSDIAPDDSASNVSSSRHRRPKRRNERRTPAPVEEEDEGEDEEVEDEDEVVVGSRVRKASQAGKWR